MARNLHETVSYAVMERIRERSGRTGRANEVSWGGEPCRWRFYAMRKAKPCSSSCCSSSASTPSHGDCLPKSYSSCVQTSYAGSAAEVASAAEVRRVYKAARVAAECSMLLFRRPVKNVTSAAAATVAVAAETEVVYESAVVQNTVDSDDG